MERRPKGKSRSKPDPGNLAVRDCRGACGNMLHGLVTICHEVGNDGYLGSYLPKTGVRHISISTNPGPLFLNMFHSYPSWSLEMSKLPFNSFGMFSSITN
jgi:hypothetical protein